MDSGFSNLVIIDTLLKNSFYNVKISFYNSNI